MVRPLCLSLLLATVALGAQDTFRDALHVVPISDDLVLAHFEFDVSSRNASGHYNFFPNAMARILDAYAVVNLRLSMTHGLWRQTWGYYAPVAPTGALLYALFEANGSADNNWRRLVQSLSGLFCASFSQINSAHSYSAAYAVTDHGIVSNKANSPFERYGVLPSENVCTENLTPWQKLLPCKRDRGLLALLNPKQIYNSPYSSMAIHAQRKCLDVNCSQIDYSLRQTVTFALENQKNAWSVEALFGKRVSLPCPLSSPSWVIVKVNQIAEDADLASFSDAEKLGSRFVAVDSSRWIAEATAPLLDVDTTPLQTLPLTLTSRIYGLGFQNLSFCHELKNEADWQMVALFRQVVPWFLRIYFHTIQYACTSHGSAFDLLHYQPARDRVQPYVLELSLHVPAGSTCWLKFNFDKSLLRWTEYPPDANYGFLLPAASVQFFSRGPIVDSAAVNSGLKATRGHAESMPPIQIYGDQLLIYLATPDFSMPYNVLCLVCTVLALTFGPVQNLTTRSLVYQSKNTFSIMFKLIKVIRCLVKCDKIWNPPPETNDNDPDVQQDRIF